MDILDNPFHTLRATLRDNRATIMEHADERSLVEDPEHCTKARATLTHPKKRLTAELSWLPGLSPKRVAAAIKVLKSDVSRVSNLESFPPLARANLISAALPRVTGSLDRAAFTQWLLSLAHAVDEIDSEAVLRLINDERSLSGFPEVTDIAVVEEQLAELRKHYQSAVKRALDELDTDDLVQVVTDAVDEATDYGSQHAPALLDDIVDRYEVDAHRFLEQEADNVGKLLDTISGNAKSGANDSALEPLVAKLETVVKNWDRVAQPIQVSNTSRGLEHVMSRELAGRIRSVAVDLYNEHQLLDVSQRITKLQQEVFAEVVSAAEQAEEDAEQLANLASQMAEAEADNEEWRNELFYEVELGLVFKDKLRITADGIDWKERHWPLEDISRIRWGATRHSTNGIPTGTTYSIFFGTQSALANITPKKEIVFQEFTSRLYRGVGARLMMEMLSGLRSGETYRYGTAVIDDRGVNLETRKLFSANERRHYTWSELLIGSGGGVFCIWRKDDKKTTVELSYQDDDNVHILESAIRMFWKRGGSKLSDIIS